MYKYNKRYNFELKPIEKEIINYCGNGKYK